MHSQGPPEDASIGRFAPLPDGASVPCCWRRCLRGMMQLAENLKGLGGGLLGEQVSDAHRAELAQGRQRLPSNVGVQALRAWPQETQTLHEGGRSYLLNLCFAGECRCGTDTAPLCKRSTPSQKTN
jgi:hypothetical protein